MACTRAAVGCQIRIPCRSPLPGEAGRYSITGYSQIPRLEIVLRSQRLSVNDPVTRRHLTRVERRGNRSWNLIAA
jgi:hypothetical protein